jgi:hypothetical protein
MLVRCLLILSLAACSGSSTSAADGGAPDAGPNGDDTPILDRPPRIEHACAVASETAVLAENQDLSGVALARTGAGYFAAHPARDPQTFASTLAMSKLRFDPNELVAAGFQAPGNYQTSPALAVRADTLALSWIEDGLRAAVFDEEGELVAGPTAIPVAGPIGSQALAASDDGFGILFRGAAGLRFVELDQDGAAVRDPVEVASGQFGAPHLVSHGDGFAAVWPGDGALHFALLDRSGAATAGPVNLSGPEREDFFHHSPFVAASGDGLLVAWVENYHNGDFADPEGHSLIRLARLSADGQPLGPAVRLQAAEAEVVNGGPSLLPLGGAISIAWSRGTYIHVCAGCITDNTMRFVLLDPVALVPVSDVIEIVGPSGLGSAPVAGQDGEAAFLLTVDYHALVDLAAARIRCEPPS